MSITGKIGDGIPRWFGHVVRSSEGSTANTAIELNPSSTRPVGQPKKRRLGILKEEYMKRANFSTEDALSRKK